MIPSSLANSLIARPKIVLDGGEARLPFAFRPMRPPPRIVTTVLYALYTIPYQSADDSIFDKKAPDPRSEMLSEEFTISAARTCKSSADKTGHDFAGNRNVILRLRTISRFFDAEKLKGLA